MHRDGKKSVGKEWREGSVEMKLYIDEGWGVIRVGKSGGLNF